MAHRLVFVATCPRDAHQFEAPASRNKNPNVSLFVSLCLLSVPPSHCPMSTHHPHPTWAHREVPPASRSPVCLQNHLLALNLGFIRVSPSIACSSAPVHLTYSRLRAPACPVAGGWRDLPACSNHMWAACFCVSSPKLSLSHHVVHLDSQLPTVPAPSPKNLN